MNKERIRELARATQIEDSHKYRIAPTTLEQIEHQKICHAITCGILEFSISLRRRHPEIFDEILKLTSEVTDLPASFLRTMRDTNEIFTFFPQHWKLPEGIKTIEDIENKFEDAQPKFINKTRQENLGL